MRYFIHLSYDGTRYHGWQIQPNGISVEGEVERCLTTLLRTPIDIVGAGRTDAGVHARHIAAHFDATLPVSYREDGGLQQLQYRLNRMLPPDIYIYKVEEVNATMLSLPPQTLIQPYRLHLPFFEEERRMPFRLHSLPSLPDC